LVWCGGRAIDWAIQVPTGADIAMAL